MTLKRMMTLRQPMSLEEPVLSTHITPIVRRAIHVTSAIDERYLWVDTVCVIDDDLVELDEQLKQMGAIYTSAIVTIIAADGDAQDALSGLRDTSPPRNLHQVVIPFGEEKILVRNTGMFSMVDDTPYYSRAWTYQEFMTSKRKILFNHKEAHWQCQCNVWHEELIFGAEIDTYIDPRMSVVLAGFPDLGSLDNIILNYNKLELSYETDALSGISGLLSILSRSFVGGFLYGLPEMYFDRTLGWKPIFPHCELTKRSPPGDADGPQRPFSALPSWSWVAWQGRTSIGIYGEACRINDRQTRIEETIPVTTWYTGSSSSGSSLRRIRSTWFESRDSFKDFTKPLPKGWTRHETSQKMKSDGASRLWPDRCGDSVFRHTNMPDEDCDSWYYPFPVADINENTPFFTPEQTPYLFCQTKKARLWASHTGTHKTMHLQKDRSSSDNIGTLILHNDEQLEQFLETQDGRSQNPGGLVDLVAIYRSKACVRPFNKEERRYESSFYTEETYAVLWVEWKDGIAYRLASGSVNKADWETLELEDIALILG